MPLLFSITALSPDGNRQLYANTMPIVDTLLPGLELTRQLVFEEVE